MPTDKIQHETSIGVFEFSITSDQPLAECDLVISNPEISLPDGMSVENCVAVLVRAKTGTAIRGLIWKSTCLEQISGMPSSGEGLEANEWEAKGRLVVVGTEDEDYLAARLPFVELMPDKSLCQLSGQGIQVSLPYVPSQTSISLHFVVAENPAPEPAECSCWYAVDYPHAALFDG
ncbi:MAG: hypothetical protein ACE37H_05840 [Phycisphaeraceae bacterium]